jgi:DnaJ-like protein
MRCAAGPVAGWSEDMALDFDPYAVLGLPADATDAQIAQARRRLSRAYHPDVNSAPDAAARFDQIQRAFEWLSDPAARAEYDRTGSRLGAARMTYRRGPAAGPATETAPAPPPRTSEPVRRASPVPGRPAPARPAWAGPVAALLVLVTICVLLATHVISRTGASTNGPGSAPGGRGAGPAASAAPPPHPVSVPRSRAALDVQPVFRVNTGMADDMAAEFGSGIAALPEQHGFEMLLPMRFLPSSGAPDCVDIQVPEADSAGSYQGVAGDAFTEYPVATIRAAAGSGIAEELVYPAVLPGTYVFDPYCMPGSGEANYSVVTLGSVTTRNLGVEDGAPAALSGNAMVVFAVHTSGAATTVSYGAIGAEDGDSLTPPGNGSCVGNGATGGQTRYWQPARALVSQRVTGKREWFETGTLVFRETGAGSPRGTFYYDCADNSVPGMPGMPGVRVP